MEQNKIQNSRGDGFATVYKIASIVMTVALLIIGAVVFALSFESDSRYLLSSPIVIALYIAIGISVAFALSSFFLFNGMSVAPSCIVTRRITASLSALASAVPFIYYIYSDVSARIAAFSAPVGSSEASYNGLDTLSTLIVLISAVSLICSLYLVIRHSKIAALLAGYSRVIFLALIITKLYIDFSVELNSPVKILVQFAAAAAMLATTTSLKPIIRAPKAGAFLSAQFISAALCMLCFTLFALEIAPHSAKYTTDLFVFPVMLLVFGIESIVLLLTCRIVPSATTAKVTEGSNEESTIETNETDDASNAAEVSTEADTTETSDQ